MYLDFVYTNTVYSTFTCKHPTLLNKTIEWLYLNSTVSSSLLNLSPSHTLLHKDLTFDIGHSTHSSASNPSTNKTRGKNGKHHTKRGRLPINRRSKQTNEQTHGATENKTDDKVD